MRHIPEEELHAYLDQGLSRTQCVEIESHLAACPSCQGARDGIAALRDRTTALLSRLAPQRTIPASFESLRRRADEAISARRRRLHLVAWAASLVLAVGLGWSASVFLRPRESNSLAERAAASPANPVTTPARTASATAPGPPAAAADTVSAPATVRPSRETRRPTAVRIADTSAPAPDREAVLSVLNTQPAPELSKLEAPRSTGEEFSGMWRTMSWAGAQAEAGKPLPHIDGLPIVQVQVQNAEGAHPLMVVAQQLTSGQVIRTIEGPASDVSQLLARRAPADIDSVQLRGDSSVPAGAIDQDHAMAMQLGDRMLAITGDLPSDSLRAMIRRLNAEMRSK
ncbi:MAG: anti-sigma factor family protein [Gemmatimonadales bacterium]